MERYWVYLDNKVQGPIEIPSLRKLSGFNLLTQVCVEGQESWRVADEVIEIKAYFAAPPRGSSLVPDTQPDLPVAEKPQIELAMPSTSVIETLPEMPGVQAGNTAPKPMATPAVQTAAQAAFGQASPAESLRQSCATCGYKNPRDVAVCMKCGSPLKTAGAPVEDKPKISLNPLPFKPERVTPAPLSVDPVIVESSSPMVEIPVKRIAIILVSITLAGCVVMAVRHIWKTKHHPAIALHPKVINTLPQPPAEPMSYTKKEKAAAHHKSAQTRPAPATVAALPGLSGKRHAERGTQNAEEGNFHKEKQIPNSESRTPHAASSVSDSQATASYTVIPEAAPLKHRQSAPVDSRYAVKRRGDKSMWSGRENEAIQMVQHYRIYGGQRTIGRNNEILMQILRDREYTTAYESGKRIYLFDDVDWAVSQTGNATFEARLTLSGGKEADGSPRAPLRFAFNVDLERQTVMAGGSGLIKSNTQHAFFDESRIPPEDRRSVAKDTEELVKAAQPDASPLALETITRQYSDTYSRPALQRVADAYGLTLVSKRLAHDTVAVKDVLPDGTLGMNGAVQPEQVSTKPVKAMPMSMSGTIQYGMADGNDRERLITVKAPSQASPAKLWETLTGYDRLTQFIPDLLISQREGQDGNAIIVHTVSLTRYMFFVFKTNLHLRILENTSQHRLEFERIAGDFDKFTGYVQIAPDPTGTRSTIEIHLTVVPKGHMANSIMHTMTQRFIVPGVDALRSKAESN
jgi:hypothetical protein